MTTVLARPEGAWQEGQAHRLTKGNVTLHADADSFDFHLTLPLNYSEVDLEWGLLEAAGLGLELIPEADDEAELLGDGPDYVRIHLIPCSIDPKDPPVCR
ncbi:hypothetical protein [Streptomyces nitrosporeus]|uniref:hypothetical protein n=1 Tax=Streptomyces nitrosporeus TaxID=28894 RepID=UPI003321907A